MFPVTPLASGPVPDKAPKAQAIAPAASLTVARGKFFSYALPQGWHVGEDGQFALTVVAPDEKAFTVMVGNAGLPPGYPPDRFVSEKLMALQPQGLRVGQGKPAAPVSGFMQAWAFDVEQRARDVVSRCCEGPRYDGV